MQTKQLMFGWKNKAFGIYIYIYSQPTSHNLQLYTAAVCFPLSPNDTTEHVNFLASPRVRAVVQSAMDPNDLDAAAVRRLVEMFLAL